MNCKEVERLLTEDLAWEGDPQVESHLERCGPCSKLHQDLLLLREWSGELREEVKAPADFSAHVMREVRSPGFLAGFLLSPTRAGLVLVTVFGLMAMGDLSLEALFRDGGGSRAWESALESRQGITVFELNADPEGTGGTSYVEVVLEDPTESEYILRLPSTIEIRRTEFQSEFYLQNVSH